MRMTTNKFRVMMEVDKEADKDDQVNREVVIREHLLKKRMFSFGHCPNYLSPPHPISGNLYIFFRTSKPTFCAYEKKIPIIIMTVQ